MRPLSVPPKLFPDSPNWQQSDIGIWYCCYNDIDMYIIDGFDNEPVGWSAQWGVDEFDEPQFENEDIKSSKEAVEWLRDQFDPKKREVPKRLAPKLILYGFDFNKWVERWDLDPTMNVPCSKCGTPRFPTLPFLQGNLRGILSEPCTCGSSSKAPYSFVTIHGGLFREGDF